MCRLVRRVAGFVCVAVWSCLGGSAAWATFINSNDLFLAPASVPVRIYNPIDIDPGNSVTFSSSEVPGATALVGMHILPVLNPNPASTDGSYTRAQLGGINSGNYTGYYAFQPNADYFATTISGNASTATFDKDGFYFVELQTIKGKHLSNHVFLVAADDALAEDPAAGAKDKVGPQRKITLPAVDLTIISDGDPNDDHGGKGAMANAMKLFPTAMKAKTIADVIKDIKDYYDSHGKKKFEVLIIGHGRPGSIKIGKQRINNDADSTITPGGIPGGGRSVRQLHPLRKLQYRCRREGSRVPEGDCRFRTAGERL